MKVIQKNKTAEDAASLFSAEKQANGFEYEGLHPYRDAAGKVIYWRIRYKHPDGRKWIRPMHLADDGYHLSEPSAIKSGPKPLYGLHLIAEFPVANVWIVEGEKCADALNMFFRYHQCLDADLAVTAGGANSVDDVDWKPLRERVCYIWPDNDPIGFKSASAIARILMEQDHD